jgi:hypothetical protein
MPFHFGQNYKDIQSYEVMKTGCFANVELIIWLLILGKYRVYRFDDILSEKWKMNTNVSFTICPNVPGDFTPKVL